MRHPTTKLILLSLLLLAGQILFAQKPSKKAARYFEKVTDIIKGNYYFIDSINFSELKLRAKIFLSNAKSTEDTYPAIDTVLYNLYDKHSYFWKPLINNTIDSIFPLMYPTGYVLTGNIGYIKVPPMVGHNNLSQTWADSLRNIYNRIKSKNIIGWIIDLRGNFGGNVHPMLTGLYPFFGDTTIATFKIKNYGEGEYKFSNESLVESSSNKTLFAFQKYKTNNMLPDRRKVAVLINNEVASSGEIIAITFLDRPNTKLFGTPTAGIPTAVRNWTLPNGAILGIVIGAFIDKNRKEYLTSIKPAVNVAQRKDNSNFDETVIKATEYLLTK